MKKSTLPEGPVTEVEPYVALASGYDVVMEHVEYEAWADYVHDLLAEWAPDTNTVLELGCGTGTLAMALQPLGPYHYLGTDRTDAMINVARAKAGLLGSDVRFEIAEFTTVGVASPFDAVLLLYDGLNYLLEESDVVATLARVMDALRPGGLFIFDLSTPANSLNNASFFEDEGEADAFVYRRRSRYDEESRLHSTEFDMVIEGVAYREIHRQRAYEINHLRRLALESGFEIEAVLDGFSFDEAEKATERAHFVLRRPS